MGHAPAQHVRLGEDALAAEVVIPGASGWWGCRGDDREYREERRAGPFGQILSQRRPGGHSDGGTIGERDGVGGCGGSGAGQDGVGEGKGRVLHHADC